MKGYLTSYVRLFDVQPDKAPPVTDIKIPLIQRDYAQGRDSTAVEEIRRNFLNVLLNAIAGGESVGLDFIYGSVVDKILEPLDGQQRLTTLFLLHWYIATAAGTLSSEASWTRLSYATRPSARTFCEHLVRNSLPGAELPSDWIVDQPWYLYMWRDDPTIQSMLVMIDAIHEEIGRNFPDLDLKDAWNRLTDKTNPAISFYVLPLDDMESPEDLYIKMNSRGKPLTPFETFKAGFEKDIEYSGKADEFAHRIDGPWSDLLWPFHGGDNIIDNQFMRYLDFITELSEYREERLASGSFDKRAREIFGPDNPGAGGHLNFMFAAFDCWSGVDIDQTFRECFDTDLLDTDWNSKKVVIFGPDNPNLLELCLQTFGDVSGKTRVFPLQQSLLLYAVTLHRIEDTGDFARRLRVLRNLISASEDEIRRDRMPGLIKDVENLVRSGQLNEIHTFNSLQVAEEQLKEAFLRDHPDMQSPLYRLEDHPILRGSLTAFELDAGKFEQRARAFELALNDPAAWDELTRALLTVGDYQRQRPPTQAWQFGSSSSRRESVWRYLFTNGSRDSLVGTRAVLGKFLDGLAEHGIVSIKDLCEALIESWLTHRKDTAHFDWRYYFVKYRGTNTSDTGIHYGEEEDLDYRIRVLRTTSLSGYHRDLILLAVWARSNVGDESVKDPWFINSDADRRLDLVQSGICMRNSQTGFTLERPSAPSLDGVFIGICQRHENILVEGSDVQINIPQANSVDTIDRVAFGAELLRELVDAGL